MINHDIFHCHVSKISDGFLSVDKQELHKAISVLIEAIKNGKTIFTCGNGASAAIASHWACDYTKGCSRLEDGIKPRVVSLSTNVPLMTAIANDISYKEVYSYQLERMASEGDLLIVISSSGNSPNVVEALCAASLMGLTTIALTGFDGGQSKKLADVKLHVDLQEYEATEDVHQALMHILAKYLRKYLWST